VSPYQVPHDQSFYVKNTDSDRKKLYDSMPPCTDQLVKFIVFCIVPEKEHALQKFRFNSGRRQTNSSLLHPINVTLFAAGVVTHSVYCNLMVAHIAHNY
jgi:hypothetical protein